MFPSKEQEVPEVLQPWVYSGTYRGHRDVIEAVGYNDKGRGS